MANEKFNNVLKLIKAVFELIADLLPVAEDALAVVEAVRQAIREFKEKQ